ncbi:MAG: hypothetical protein WA981_03230 [Glaciecola sp.]
MIPNIGQLLLVCTIAFVVVGAIFWLVIKIPDESVDDHNDDGFGRD